MELSRQVNHYNYDQDGPSLSEQREEAEECLIVMLTELLLLPLLP